MRVRVTLAGLLLTSGCSLLVSLDDLGGDASNTGTLGAPCYANGTCNTGLACILVGGSGECELGDAAVEASLDASPEGSPDANPVDAANTDASGFSPAIGCSAQADLLAYYTLDEKTALTAHDCVLPANAGNVSTSFHSAWVTGKYSGGLQLIASDGGCAHVDFQTPDFAFGGQPTNPFTVTVWLLLQSLPPNGDLAYVVGKSSNIAAGGWRLGVLPTGMVSFAVADGSGGTATASGPSNVGVGTWHHLAAVFDGKIHVYVDGVAGSATTQASFPPDNMNGDDLRIGCSADNQHQTAGTFDELRFYDRALAPSEIVTLMSL